MNKLISKKYQACSLPSEMPPGDVAEGTGVCAVHRVAVVAGFHAMAAVGPFGIALCARGVFARLADLYEIIAHVRHLVNSFPFDRAHGKSSS